MAINCWEFKNCERGVDGAKVRELGICPATVATEADGFCGGKNGGRGCAYIVGSFCSGIFQGSVADEAKECFRCDFFLKLKQEHGVEQSVVSFGKYVKNNRI
jgi:hypothetical protein